MYFHIPNTHDDGDIIERDDVIDEQIVTKELRVTAYLYFHVYTMDGKPITFIHPTPTKKNVVEAAFGDGIEELDGITYKYQFRGMVAFEKDGQKVRKNCQAVKRIEVVDGKTHNRIVLGTGGDRDHHKHIDQLYEANNGFGKLYVELDLY
ncbi:hypothetical protein Ddc_14124 [Ditylenchus destructor]|nr:hypothetical protein Ddc_14124 [Ditylenchus destructor]